jgi:hypothetical protein
VKIKINRFDVIKLCLYVGAFLSGLPGLLAQSGLFPQNEVTKIGAVISLIAGITGLIANTLRNPSAPSGASYAVIPNGTIPVVGTPTEAGGMQAAKIADPTTTTVVSINNPNQPNTNKGA